LPARQGGNADRNWKPVADGVRLWEDDGPTETLLSSDLACARAGAVGILDYRRKAAVTGRWFGPRV